MRLPRKIFLLCLLGVSTSLAVFAQDPPLCDEFVAALSPYMTLGNPPRLGERLEIRRCNAEDMIGGSLAVVRVGEELAQTIVGGRHRPGRCRATDDVPWCCGRRNRWRNREPRVCLRI